VTGVWEGTASALAEDDGTPFPELVAKHGYEGAKAIEAERAQEEGRDGGGDGRRRRSEVDGGGRTEPATPSDTETAHDLAQAIAKVTRLRVPWRAAVELYQRADLTERVAREAYEQARAELGALVRRSASLEPQERL